MLNFGKTANVEVSPKGMLHPRPNARRRRQARRHRFSSVRKRLAEAKRENFGRIASASQARRNLPTQELRRRSGDDDARFLRVDQAPNKTFPAGNVLYFVEEEPGQTV